MEKNPETGYDGVGWSHPTTGHTHQLSLKNKNKKNLYYE